VVKLGEDYFDLLGCFRSEYLSISAIDRLLDSISLCDVDERLWSSLSVRCRLVVQPSGDLTRDSVISDDLPSCELSASIAADDEYIGAI
jgi:hypothetical protein